MAMNMIRTAVAALWLVATPAFAQETLIPDDPAFAAAALTWRGEHRWTWQSADGETGILALDVIALPGGNYLLTGTFLLDDAELGVSGAGRWRSGRLILDLTVIGGVRDVVPDAGKRRLYARGKAPARVDATGFAAFRAELDTSLGGVSQQFQTNVVTGDKIQGPVHRLGTLRPLR